MTPRDYAEGLRKFLVWGDLISLLKRRCGKPDMLLGRPKIKQAREERRMVVKYGEISPHIAVRALKMITGLSQEEWVRKMEERRMKAEKRGCGCAKEVEKKVTIKLSQEEYDTLVRFARRDRRVPSAQAAEMLSDALDMEVEEECYDREMAVKVDPHLSDEIAFDKTGVAQFAKPKTTEERELEMVGTARPSEEMVKAEK